MEKLNLQRDESEFYRLEVKYVACDLTVSVRTYIPQH